MNDRSEEAVQSVAALVREINRAWVEKRPDDLTHYFDPDVVAMPPGVHEPIVGRERLVSSYREFVNSCTVHNFEELSLRVDVFHATAVTSLRFRIKYEAQDQVHDEEGTDILVFARAAEGWRVVWRTQLP